MPMLTETLDLDQLRLVFGEGERLELTVHLDDVELGGQDYVVDPEEVPVVLDVSKTSAGYALRMRFAVSLSGPCMRCLEPATARVEVDAREVDQPADHSGARHDEDEGEDAGAAELESPYVEQGMLDVASWAHDALVLALPAQILCREDCLGLCSVCGQPLNDAKPGEHDHAENLDPRWAKLRDLG